MRRPSKKDSVLWVLIFALLTLPISLMLISHKGHISFMARSHDAGWAFMSQAGYFPEPYYQEHEFKKPRHFNYTAFVTGPWGRVGNYLLNTNLLMQGAENPNGRIAAIIEERINDVPGPFLLKPLLRLTGWQPWRLVIYNNGTMAFTVPREFKTFDLSSFVASDDLPTQQPHPAP